MSGGEGEEADCKPFKSQKFSYLLLRQFCFGALKLSRFLIARQLQAVAEAAGGVGERESRGSRRSRRDRGSSRVVATAVDH